MLAFALLIDIYVLNKILSFYKIIWILILPLLFKSILSLTYDYSIKKNKGELTRNYLHIELIPNSTRNNVSTKVNVNLNAISFSKYVSRWSQYMTFLDITHVIYNCDKQKYIRALCLLYTIMYITGWASLIYLITVVFFTSFCQNGFIDIISWLLKIIIGI